MRLLNKLSSFEGFDVDWRRLMVQWVIIMLAGIFMALASVVNSDAVILSAREFSWLPMSGMIIFMLGLLECLDAFLAKEQRDVIQNLQVGVLDTVIGILIISSVSGVASRLGMMISAFLIVRGIVRIALAYALDLPLKVSTSIVGIISVILGVLIFQEWPTSDAWFMSLCLNIEIAFRGWAGISFALWVRKQKLRDEQKKS
ncbi:MAG: hypothetical protein KAQ91_00860 [Methylococcales bacterium]|nr:hypothetical protein [Methylococcales bacterium]